MERKEDRQIWKTAAAALLVVFGTLLLGGCDTVNAVVRQTGLVESPYYHLGDTEWDHGGIEEYWFNQIPSEMNEIYRELYSRLSDQEEEAVLFASVTTDDFWKAYYAVQYDHPEFFWIGPDVQVKESALSHTVISYQVSVITEQEDREIMRRELEAAADECIAGIPEGASDYEKIKAVYEYIINTTDYDTDSPDNQNIQSVLLNRRSVCAGYSRAFQYILHRMGMFCTYATGRTTSGEEHAWNIVRIDDNYYNVDVTWGDPVFAGEQENESRSLMNYNYLCCTDEELNTTHIADTDYPLPACTDDSYNYYKLNGMYYENFDYDTVYNALMNSVWSEESSICLKFGSQEAYESAEYEMFSNGMLHDAAQYLMKIYRASQWNYQYQTDDEFRLITIYWK